jgi:hypothetical protein
MDGFFCVGERHEHSDLVGEFCHGSDMLGFRLFSPRVTKKKGERERETASAALSAWTWNHYSASYTSYVF